MIKIIIVLHKVLITKTGSAKSTLVLSTGFEKGHNYILVILTITLRKHSTQQLHLGNQTKEA